MVLNVAKMSSLREKLAKKNLFCDFSAGAIETFAYDFPKSVVLSEFEIKIQYTQEVTNYRSHSVNNCYRITHRNKRKIRIILLGNHH